MNPAGETGPAKAEGRRRRRNRPGNAQAKGPQGDESLESSSVRKAPLTDGVSCPTRRCLARPLFGEGLASEISQVPRQRGLGRARLPGFETYDGTGHDPGARSPMLTPPSSGGGDCASARGRGDRDRRCRSAARSRAAAEDPAARAACRARRRRMVPFAGYDMPVQYADGIIAEHNHVREQAGLFDVSHMGQAFLVGADHETVARALETLVPGDIVGLAPGRQRYTQLLDDNGGILDDLMVTRLGRSGRGRRAVPGRQRRHQGGGLRASRGAAARRACDCCARTIVRSSPCRGRPRCARSGGIARTWCRCRS